MKYAIVHTDLDGMGCDVVARKAIQHLRVRKANYDKIEALINDILDEKPETLVIADVFPNTLTPETFHRLCAYDGQLMIFDHHATAEPLQMRLASERRCLLSDNVPIARGKDWPLDAVVIGEGASATQRMAWFFDIDIPAVREINRYDLSGCTDGIAGALNMLFWEMDSTEFRKILRREDLVLTKPEQEKLDELKSESEQSYINCLPSLEAREYNGMSIGYVTASKNKGWVSNRLLSRYDYVIIKDDKRNSLSYRGNLPGCDTVAKRLGGGGHPYASGSPGNHTMSEIFNVWKEILIEE